MNKHFTPRAARLAISIIALLATQAFAQNSNQQDPERGDHPHGPPPEAIAACKGKAVDAACTFTGRQGEHLTGTCFVPPPRPANAPQDGQQNASNGKSSDNSTKPLACRPPRRN
jgi:hypothetical protein